MPKQTKLGEDALIYHPKTKQTEKEKLREMSLRGKFDYLWEYYKIHALTVVIAIAIIIYFIYSAFHPNMVPQFYAAMLNNTINEDVLEQYNTDFAEYLQLNPERERVEFNTNFNFVADGQYTMSMRQALVTYVASAEVDVIIAPESLFHDYAYSGYFSKLSDQLPTDIYSTLTDQLYITDTKENSERNDYGVYLTDTKLYKNNANNTDPYILGIVANSKHEENTIDFIRYLFNDK
ncbi:MAG: hypothetical protein PHF63_12560 [Herbinix sp.]|nr:hypothetical protein [Herbinix sp.]